MKAPTLSRATGPRLRGGWPVLSAVDGQAAELDRLADKIRTWVDAGVDPSEIAVATRFHDFGSRAKQRLLDEGVAAVAVVPVACPLERAIRGTYGHSRGRHCVGAGQRFRR
jgi:hypothetical protein